MLRTIASQIEKAWKETGKEFAYHKNPKSIFWTEQAALKYPFYFNLRRQLKKSNISQKLAVIPEYRPSVPLNATCGDKHCICIKTPRHKKQIHIDLCLVEFKENVYMSSIKNKEGKYRNMWCFKPQPIVAMEFKYYYKFDKWLFNEDVKKLKTMEKMYGAQLLYICFATYEEADIRLALEYIKQGIGQGYSLRKKFRLAAGTLKKTDWEILPIE